MHKNVSEIPQIWKGHKILTHINEMLDCVIPNIYDNRVCIDQCDISNFKIDDNRYND